MTLTKEKSIKFTEANYLDCKYAGMNQNQIANVFGLTLEELKVQASKVKEGSLNGRPTKFTYKAYRKAIKKGVYGTVGLAKLFDITPQTVYNKKRIWNEMGLQLEEPVTKTVLVEVKDKCNKLEAEKAKLEFNNRELHEKLKNISAAKQQKQSIVSKFLKKFK